MKTKLIAIASFFLIISACSSNKSTIQEPTTIAVKMNKDEAGKMLYENNCAKCHDLYSPKDFNAEQWKPIMLSMQKKAKISDEEREIIYAYLTK
ncbi:cytochrome c [Flavobacterium sp. HXWNR29]|uniref:c-type cytochrome n=1 Tax=Flavobacterium odoriferum TaxID=2946604 RepID=UPI0021CAF654|nr:cytochrome c [Flavobacterium sp. HXWNR29]MCU4188140.1 cytochrome c [Flavobacterium sp. HXWNR29]